MTVVLDAKDLLQIDQEMKADSQIWDVLQGGASQVTAADFVGAHEVRINKMSGFAEPTKYVRNGDNELKTVSIEKETLQLTQEDWFGYQLDQLDQEENRAYSVANTVEQHTRLVTIPRRDKYAAQVLFDTAKAGSNQLITDTIDSKNALAAYDDAEQYMLDNEVPGGYVMFVSGSYYKALKNADGVAKSFTTNEASINGINRTVAQLDGGVPILRVAKDRIQGNTISQTHNVNFMLVPLFAVAPVMKWNTVDIIPAAYDTKGYRDTIKSLNYYDLFTFDNTKKSIYVAATPVSGSSSK